MGSLGKPCQSALTESLRVALLLFCLSYLFGLFFLKKNIPSSKFCAIIMANNAITQLLNPQQYHFLHVNEIHRTSLVCPRYTSWSATSHRRVEAVLKTTCIIYNIDRHASKSFLQLPVSASDNSRNPESRVRGPESRHIAEELAKSLVLSPIHPLCPYSKQIFLR